ncbi:MAG: hypothetical protein ACM3Q2_01120 [Syntrophothermus sp.]
MIKYRAVSAILIILYAMTSFMCNAPAEPAAPGVINSASDTTSQNFSFQSFSFGDGTETGILNDVWVFNRNNIWAVGLVTYEDEASTNILHWDGRAWQKVASLFNESGFEGIWALDSTHIYFAAGGIARYDNGSFEIMPMNIQFERGQGINLLWGSSERNIWGAGPSGTLAYYDGTQWKQISFDRQWYFYKLTGSCRSGMGYALARNSRDEMIIVRLSGASASIIYNSSISENHLTANTMTMASENEIYCAGSSVWRFNAYNFESKVLYTPSETSYFEQGYTNASNDIFFTGTDNSGSILLHFNGLRFTKFTLPENYDISGDIYVKGNLAVTVGSSDNKASIIEIMRQ